MRTSALRTVSHSSGPEKHELRNVTEDGAEKPPCGPDAFAFWNQQVTVPATRGLDKGDGGGGG